MDTINKRQIQLAKVLSHCFVSHQHKGLNHTFSNTTMTKDNINWLAFFIYQNLSFIGIKI